MPASSMNISPVYSCEPRAAPAATIRMSAAMPTRIAVVYSRIFGPGRGTPITRATRTGLAVESDSSAVRLRSSWPVPASSQSRPSATAAASARLRHRPSLLEGAGEPERGRAEAAMDVLALGGHLEREAVERELREHRLLGVERAAVDGEVLVALAVGGLQDAGERGQVGGAADDLDPPLRRGDPERVGADDRRLVRGEHVEQAGREQPGVPVVGHRPGS